jgi:hypothetical protein
MAQLEHQRTRILNLELMLGRRKTPPADGILRHHFDKRLESFAPCYSQSLLLADFKENRTLL